MTAIAAREAAEAHRSTEDATAVLTNAVVRAAKLLGLNQATVAQALGVSTSTASRMFGGQYQLDRSKKEWELASLFVRVFRSLDSIVGGSETHARAWVSSENRPLGAPPVNLLVTAEGLVRVVHYLDAARGRI
jgi:DNA-binding XRE family transcriptional regulator